MKTPATERAASFTPDQMHDWLELLGVLELEPHLDLSVRSFPGNFEVELYDLDRSHFEATGPKLGPLAHEVLDHSRARRAPERAAARSGCSQP